MSGSDRDLVLALRSELAAIDPARPCDRAAEASALLLGRRRGPAGDPPLARLVVRLAREREPETPDAATAFDWDRAAEHCRVAWLRGLFLARGSLSLAGGRTHLEFVVDPGDAPVLARRLSGIELPASWRVRRGRGVVTWKSGDTIGLFLRRIGANAALLELEARQVSRALRGDLNRVLNAESANLQRSVGAAGRQVAAIDELTASGDLARQSYVVRAVAEARRETPEASLAELAERLELHRSAVQRALERIERLAASPDDGGAGRVPRTSSSGSSSGGALA
ncbi:MAG TPA: DNA-binding protein WhiA [Candidatus Limnocylindrales bacterium]|nr:DNA-binding protein WhiA [Candidatus Limnocylindrales bacterium]